MIAVHEVSSGIIGVNRKGQVREKKTNKEVLDREKVVRVKYGGLFWVEK